MPKPIKVACVLDMYDGVGPSACGYIRLLLPLTKAVARGRISVQFLNADDIDCIDADIVVTQRVAFKSIAAVENLLTRCKRACARLVYDLDDDLLALGDEHPERLAYADFAPVVLRLAAEADELWVSTQTLASRFAPINSNTVVLQNELDARIWRPLTPSPRGALRVMCMGTTSHLGDLQEIVRPAFKEICGEFGASVTLDVVGVVDDGPSYSGERLIVPPRASALAYPAFAAWLQRQAPYDIGLAPLTATPFNQAKSRIKLMEYSALGMATIAADVGEYAQPSAAAPTCVLAPPTSDGFFAALHSLVVDVDRRRHLRESAAAWARDHITHAAAEEPRLDRLEALAGGRRGPSAGVATRDNLRGRMDRKTLSRAFVFGDGIEVGALHNPLAVEPGVKVRYVDRMPRDDLFTQYPELRGLNLVEVDIVDNGEQLTTLAPESQDFIIANHFLEHCQDPIGTLKNFVRVLRPGGVMFVALPDRRYTYDRDRPCTSLAHLVTDHHEGPQVSRRAHFHEWATLVEPHFQRIYEGEAIEARVQELLEMDYSIHFHTFEPEDFVELAGHCVKNENMGLEIVFGGEFEGDEMIFILRKTSGAEAHGHKAVESAAAGGAAVAVGQEF